MLFIEVRNKKEEYKRKQKWFEALKRATFSFSCHLLSSRFSPPRLSSAPFSPFPVSFFSSQIWLPEIFWWKRSQMAIWSKVSGRELKSKRKEIKNEEERAPKKNSTREKTGDWRNWQDYASFDAVCCYSGRFRSDTCCHHGTLQSTLPFNAHQVDSPWSPSAQWVHAAVGCVVVWCGIVGMFWGGGGRDQKRSQKNAEGYKTKFFLSLTVFFLGNVWVWYRAVSRSF